MDDAQFPPETSDAKSTPARRSRTRLSDVETVATARLDMFGDNSLKEALAGTPSSSGDGDAADGVPADGPPEASLTQPPLDPPAAAADEPAADDPGSAYAHATSPDTSPEAPGGNDPPVEYQPDPTGDAMPTRMEVSSIFDELDAAERATQGQVEADAAPEADPESFDRTSGAEPDPDGGEEAARKAVVSIFAALDDAERASDPHAAADLPPSEERRSPDPDPSSEPELDPLPAEAATSRMEVSSIFAELIEAERHAEADPNDEAAGADDAAPPGSDAHNGWPSVPADLIGRARQEGEAAADDVADDAWGDAAASGAEPPAVFPQAASIPDISVGPPFPDPSGVASDELSHPPPFFRSELEPQPPAPPAPDDDAAARIAAERSATAEALENLQRLLDDKGPSVYAPPPAAWPDRSSERVASSPPLDGSFRINVPPAPSPFIGGTTVPLLPLPVPPERGSGKGVYVLGFLAGLGLSLMAGVVLFLFFISMG